MKKLVIFFVCLLMVSCKAKQTAVVNEVSDITRIDTTKIMADTATTIINIIDTTKSQAESTRTLQIEFIDDGGSVRVDTMGNIYLNGVKGIKGQADISRISQMGMSGKAEYTDVNNQQINGISEHHKQNTEIKEKTDKTARWYERPLIWIGTLFCIAVLIWMLFLYTKNKR